MRATRNFNFGLSGDECLDIDPRIIRLQRIGDIKTLEERKKAARAEAHKNAKNKLQLVPVDHSASASERRKHRSVTLVAYRSWD